MDKNEEPKLALRSISGLFSEAWKRYTEQWSVLMEIILLPTLIVILGTVLVLLDLGSAVRALGALVIFAGWVVFIFSILPIIYAIHHGAGVDVSYKATIGWFWPLVWVVILQVLASIGSFFMLIIPGIWLGVALSFTAFVFVIEGRRGIDALRQSKDYVKGYWWAVLGRVLLLELVYIAAMIVIRIPVSLVGGAVAGAVASSVIVPFFVPFAEVYSYLIFQNLRERKPELAEAHPNKGAGFIKASAIVGLVAPILLVILVVVLAVTGVFTAIGNATNFHGVVSVPPPGYYGQVPPIQQ